MRQVLGCGMTQKLNRGLGPNQNQGPQAEPKPVPVPELRASLSSVLSWGLSLP